MQIRLLGTGSPNPLPERLGPATLLSHAGQHLLFDAGRGVTTQLVRAGVAPEQLSGIVLTHHHYDHIGSLGDLLLTAWHGGIDALPVVGPPGTAAIVQALFEHVYQRELRFSHAHAAAAGAPLREIRDVVAVVEIDAGQTYAQGAWQIAADAVDHGRGLGLTHEEWPCLAYRVEVAGRAVAISGDTIACESLVALARGADLLVQCCFLPEMAITTPARRLLAESVIATSAQAGRIAAQAGVRALALTHFSDLTPAMLAAIEADVRRDYAGPIFLGEDLMVIDL
jgi:ribonuclease BN (tRNA processing enzyme)